MSSRRLALASLLLFVAVLSLGTRAGAQSDDDEDGVPPVTTTLPPGSQSIGLGYAFTGGTVMTPGQPDRALDAYHAAVFVQSFLPATVIAPGPELQNPPA